jgi:murein DD-endopeptidase MepM/ murein hydrolase activator NlpD
MRKSFLVTLLLCAAAYLALPMPGLSSSLPQKIDKTRQKIAGKRHHEAVLTTEITAYQVRIRSLQGEINGLQQRQSKAQAELDRKQAELQAIKNRLQIAQDRLVKLEARLAESKRVLAARLVALYKDDEPDMVSVVLEADGFADLLDRADFVSRISAQDNRIVTRVRDLTEQVTKQVKELNGLEARARAATEIVLAKRNEIAAAKGAVVKRQSEVASVRNKRQAVLARVRSARGELEGHLHTLEAEQAKIEARLRAAQTGVSTGPAGPIKRGSGNFIWPVNGPIVSPFGMRWGRLHAGVDIAVPSGTPIRAAASGTVAFTQPEASSGGYGNYTCIAHGGGISTCYAHQTSFGVSGGQHVSQGQVIGISGCTGHCFGPHVHFEVRVNGVPVDPLGYL